jgi:predicted DNA-binding protein with PD1-like motif
MKKLMIVILALSFSLAAQETRRRVIHSTRNPAQDTRPNSDQVPNVYALSGHLERIVVLRFKYNTDLLAGLQKMIKQEKIRNAVILSGFGSVRDYQVHQVGNREFPPKDVFVKNPTAPADITGMSGLVMDGRVHPHITLANADKAFGGHLEPDTKVFTFAVVILGVLDDGLDLTKFDDWTYR